MNGALIFGQLDENFENKKKLLMIQIADWI